MPLTVQGVTAQIISCIDCYKNPTFAQEENDCKVALNRLIRAFGEANKQPVFISTESITFQGKVVKEHVVPVKVMMDHLLSQNIQPRDVESFNLVKSYLEKHVVIARITSEEDKKLRKNKLHYSMPQDWNKTDIWARYTKTEIALNNIL
jgi:hypothetical protein